MTSPWKAPPPSGDSFISGTHYRTLKRCVKRWRFYIPKLEGLIGRSHGWTAVNNRWVEFVDTVRDYFNSKITMSTFGSLLLEFLKKRLAEKPGNLGKPHVAPSTFTGWATQVCMGWVLSNVNPRSPSEVRQAVPFASVHDSIPNWIQKRREILSKLPMYTQSETKYRLGEVHLLGVWDKYFPLHVCKEFEKDFSAIKLTIEQQCVLIDKWMYETLAREGEVLRKHKRHKRTYNIQHIGLYVQHLSTQVLGELDRFASRTGNFARALADIVKPKTVELAASEASLCNGFVGANDRQKTRSFSKTTHNKWHIPFRAPMPDSWKNTNREYFTNRFMLSILLKQNLMDNQVADLSDVGRPLFPDVSGTLGRFNVLKPKIDAVRARIYKPFVPRQYWSLIGGHGFRGGRAHLTVRAIHA